MIHMHGAPSCKDISPAALTYRRTDRPTDRASLRARSSENNTGAESSIIADVTAKVPRTRSRRAAAATRGARNVPVARTTCVKPVQLALRAIYEGIGAYRRQLQQSSCSVERIKMLSKNDAEGHLACPRDTTSWKTSTDVWLVPAES
jgi:hypothetical protein